MKHQSKHMSLFLILHHYTYALKYVKVTYFKFIYDRNLICDIHKMMDSHTSCKLSVRSRHYNDYAWLATSTIKAICTSCTSSRKSYLEQEVFQCSEVWSIVRSMRPALNHQLVDICRTVIRTSQTLSVPVYLLQNLQPRIWHIICIICTGKLAV